jgi:putative transposase
MTRRRPPRLHDSCYIGAQRVFLTMCTFERKAYFAERLVSDCAREQLLSTAERWCIEVVAFCFMPDHLHVLLEGTTEQADCRKCADVFRRVSGYHFERNRESRLWQGGYFDHVLRREEATLDVVRYILWNPIRARLCDDPMAYPFLGSSRYDVSDLLTAYTLG